MYESNKHNIISSSLQYIVTLASSSHMNDLNNIHK